MFIGIYILMHLWYLHMGIFFVLQINKNLKIKKFLILAREVMAFYQLERDGGPQLRGMTSPSLCPWWQELRVLRRWGRGWFLGRVPTNTLPIQRP